MKVSVVIPAFNEEGRIETTLIAVSDYFIGTGAEWEIVVADDGSEDRTAELAKRWALQNETTRSRVRVVAIPHQGKGAAVKAGFLAAGGNRVLMSDADLSTPVAEWPKLLAALDQGAAMAAGSRQAPGAEIGKHQPWLRQRLGLLFGGLVRRFFAVGVIDSQCGFKGFDAELTRPLFESLQTQGFCFDVELLARARARGLSVVEVPVKWNDRPQSRVRVFRDWPRVLSELWKIRGLVKKERTRRDPPG